MYKVLAVCKEIEPSEKPMTFYIIMNDEQKYIWHQLVIEQEGRFLSRDFKIINCIEEFKNQHKT